ncbi:MAG: nitronate monooxygenase [Hydrogenophilus sp.]|nr:nitronate monooxygenase [Hydrogenophilus sp.]
MNRRLDDYRLRFDPKGPEFVPLMLGGMGVDISNTQLALEFARLGGIGHISDAMVPTITDRHYDTEFTKEKLKKYRHNMENQDKSAVKFDLGMIAEAQRLHVETTMNAKRGPGLIFINCMEKLTMGAPKETLKVRLEAALDAGIDGITLSAGLHLGTFSLIEDHPRFRHAKIGIIVSSVRALALFLKKNARTDRLPDYVVVEGPLAGGHLGFGLDWSRYDLKTITVEILQYLAENHLTLPVIPAGGIFTGSDAVEYLELGAAAVQVATRFTVTRECGLPDEVKQEYFKAEPEDVEVNTISPTGYPMRMLKSSPAIGSGIRPNCEAYGYLLDANGHCAYIDAYYRAVAATPPGEPVRVWDKTCLCTHMRNFKVWTCGHTVSRLKETTRRLPDGTYQLLTAEHVFKDYQFSTDHTIALPDPLPAAETATPSLLTEA